jgi:hypothetical protein
MITSPPVRSGASEALRHSSHPALRQLCVEEQDSVLVITGSVTSYFMKQMAQETLKPLQGQRTLLNKVEVVRSN